MVEKEGGVGDLDVLERIEIFKGYWLFCNVKKPDVVLCYSGLQI